MVIGARDATEVIEDVSYLTAAVPAELFDELAAEGDRYDAQLNHLAELGASTETATFTVTTDDVRAACDVLSPVYQQTAAKDGRVSIEVDPRLARDAAATVDMARALRSAVDRDNMFTTMRAAF